MPFKNGSASNLNKSPSMRLSPRCITSSLFENVSVLVITHLFVALNHDDRDTCRGNVEHALSLWTEVGSALYQARY